ncbi:MAG TPA: 4Fe-4S binding protein [Firmicutes bacterium]|nr:4Fe-4S binding protein [Bacillota bacterium]
MYLVNVNADKCEGCGKCVENCPAVILVLKDGKVEVTGGPDDCMGCLSCEAVCETEAIKVQEL